MSATRLFNYDVHGLARLRLEIAGCGALRGRLIDSKFASFRRPFSGEPNIEMQIGPFTPSAPHTARVIDKHFVCAPDSVLFTGGRGGQGATEISGFTTGRILIRHQPYAESPWGGMSAGLRGVNMYLEPMLQHFLLMQSTPTWLLHGGAVARNGQAMVIVGSNGTFKTRLILELCCRHGFDFLGDDLILLQRGRVLSFVEHPAVLAERTQAVQRGSSPKTSALGLARHFLLGAELTSLPSIIPQANPAMWLVLERSTAVDHAQVQAIPASLAWKKAHAIQHLELVRNQRRHRQVANISRLAAAHEYAFPGGGLFGPLLGAAPSLPTWAQWPAADCQIPPSYDSQFAERVVAAWEQSWERSCVSAA